MKMYYGGTPIKSLNVKHYEMSASDATVQPSDLQSGVTCYTRGQKVTGTGRSFEFAMYGSVTTNASNYAPVQINIIEITSLDYPIKSSIALNSMIDIDFFNRTNCWRSGNRWS